MSLFKYALPEYSDLVARVWRAAPKKPVLKSQTASRQFPLNQPTIARKGIPSFLPKEYPNYVAPSNSRMYGGGKGATPNLNLNKERISVLYENSRRGKKILRRSMAVGGIGLMTVGSNFLVDRMKEKQRDVYGDSKAVEALETSKSIINVLGIYQGALTAIGANPFQRIASIPRDWKISKRNKRRRREAIKKGGSKESLPRDLPGTFESRVRGVASGVELGALGFLIGGQSLFAGGLLSAAGLAANFGALGSVAVGSFPAALINLGLGPAKGMPIIAAGAAGAATSMFNVLPGFAEGNIIDFRRESATERMNFSTAGLTFALRDQNRRVY